MNFLFNFIKKKKLLSFFIGVFFLVSLDLLSKAWVEKNLIKLASSEKTDHYYKLKSNLSNKTIVSYDGKSIYYKKNISVIPEYWSFNYVRNYDIGFSILSWLDYWMSIEKKTLLIKYLQLLAVIVAFSYFLSIKMLFFFPFMFVISGGAGNVIDRFFRGYVVDFIEWSFPIVPLRILNPWPVFNLADSFVFIGISFLILSVFLKKEKKSWNRKRQLNQ